MILSVNESRVSIVYIGLSNVQVCIEQYITAVRQQLGSAVQITNKQTAAIWCVSWTLIPVVLVQKQDTSSELIHASAVLTKATEL